MMGNASYWGPIAEGLANKVQISAPDLPGHGQSPDWPGTPDYHSYTTRAVAPLIDRPMDLIGHSLGATVALRIAVAAPEAVRSLTLIEPALFAAAPDPAAARPATAANARGWPARPMGVRPPAAFCRSGAASTGRRKRPPAVKGWSGRCNWSWPETRP